MKKGKIKLSWKSIFAGIGLGVFSITYLIVVGSSVFLNENWNNLDKLILSIVFIGIIGELWAGYYSNFLNKQSLFFDKMIWYGVYGLGIIGILDMVYPMPIFGGRWYLFSMWAAIFGIFNYVGKKFIWKTI